MGTIEKCFAIAAVGIFAHTIWAANEENGDKDFLKTSWVEYLGSCAQAASQSCQENMRQTWAEISTLSKTDRFMLTAAFLLFFASQADAEASQTSCPNLQGSLSSCQSQLTKYRHDMAKINDCFINWVNQINGTLTPDQITDKVIACLSSVGAPLEPFFGLVLLSYALYVL